MTEPEAPSQSELDELLQKTSTSETRTGYTTIQGFTLPVLFHKFEKQIKEFKILDTDIWICGFPKTGTTWISEISWLIENNLDYEGAKKEDYFRTHFFDLNFISDLEKADFCDTRFYDNDSINYCKNLAEPRSIKSHLPLLFLPEELKNGNQKPRIIYTARHPMDVCVSYYYQCVTFENYTGTFDDFCKLFLFDTINYGPYYKHVSSFWKARKNLNILFITYEEMHKDIRNVIRKVAKFLNKTITEEDVSRLQEYVSFDNMKNNPAVNKEAPMKALEAIGQKVAAPFLRSGKVGGYKASISPEYIQKFEFRMKRWFEETGIDFSHILDYLYSDI